MADTDIEEILAHQEQQINDLSEMLIAQGHDIAALKKHIHKLESKVNVMGEDSAADAGQGLSSIEQAAQDKPPHY